MILERDTRIELAPSPWKGDVLPLYESRLKLRYSVAVGGRPLGPITCGWSVGPLKGDASMGVDSTGGWDCVPTVSVFCSSEKYMR